MSADVLSAAEVEGTARFGVQLVLAEGAGFLIGFGRHGALSLLPVAPEGGRLQVTGPVQAAHLDGPLPPVVAAFFTPAARAAVLAQRRLGLARQGPGLRDRLLAEGWDPKYLAFLHDADLAAEDDLLVAAGRPVVVERGFCVNPVCTCHDALLELVEVAADLDQRVLGTVLVDLKRKTIRQVDAGDEGHAAQLSSLATAALADGDRLQRLRAEREWLRGALAPSNAPAIGRNDRCPCGSGKKYKLCHEGKPLAQVDLSSLLRRLGDPVPLLRPDAAGRCRAEDQLGADPTLDPALRALLMAPLRKVIGQGPGGTVHVEGGGAIPALGEAVDGSAVFVVSGPGGVWALPAPGLTAPAPGSSLLQDLVATLGALGETGVS